MTACPKCGSGPGAVCHDACPEPRGVPCRVDIGGVSLSAQYLPRSRIAVPWEHASTFYIAMGKARPEVFTVNGWAYMIHGMQAWADRFVVDMDPVCGPERSGEG